MFISHVKKITSGTNNNEDVENSVSCFGEGASIEFEEQIFDTYFFT